MKIGKKFLLEDIGKNVLKLGDVVVFNDGAFKGTGTNYKAKVIAIDKVQTGTTNSEKELNQVSWNEVNDNPNDYIISLDIGKWAHGYQIRPFSKDIKKSEYISTINKNNINKF